MGGSNEIPIAGTVRMVRAVGSVDTQLGYAEAKIQVPGEFPARGKRLTYGGEGWFSEGWHRNDRVHLFLRDDSGMIPEEARPEHPIYPVIYPYCDMAAPEENRGYFIPKGGHVIIKALGGVGRPISGLWIVGRAVVGDGRADFFYMNIEWIDPEDV